MKPPRIWVYKNICYFLYFCETQKTTEFVSSFREIIISRRKRGNHRKIFILHSSLFILHYFCYFLYLTNVELKVLRENKNTLTPWNTFVYMSRWNSRNKGNHNFAKRSTFCDFRDFCETQNLWSGGLRFAKWISRRKRGNHRKIFILHSSFPILHSSLFIFPTNGSGSLTSRWGSGSENLLNLHHQPLDRKHNGQSH